MVKVSGVFGELVVFGIEAFEVRSSESVMVEEEESDEDD